MALALRYAARTNVGLVRSRNEDSGYAGPHLLVIADGMGGHAAGNIASSLTVGDLVHLDGESHGGDDALALLGQSLHSANESLRRAMREDPELQGMGTTVTALLRTGNKLAMAHIGDSRAYLLRDGVFAQITRDHSFVQQLVDEGRLTPEEAESHPQRSLVTRVLTGQQEDEPDLSMREARVGDRYLICSDGLSDFVASDTIGEVLALGLDTGRTAERLVDLALKAGAPDNVTCVVGDIVNSDDAPSTTPEVVGAAAERKLTGRDHTAALPVSPATKAAALTREVTGTEPEEDGETVELAEEGPSSRTARWLKRGGALVLVLAVLAAGGYAAYDWTQRQVFVGDAHGKVAIYRGVAQDIGPWTLSHLEEQTEVPLDDLPDFYRSKVDATVSLTSMADARKLVTDLRLQAVTCQTRRAAGTPCGSSR